MDADIANFITVAWEAANTAGRIIRDHWQQPKTIEYKGAIDLVTSVDRECERPIVDVIRRNFPDHSILAEEETDVYSAQNHYRWIVDPLDGTTNFAHGYPQFCVSIALEQNRSHSRVGLRSDAKRMLQSGSVTAQHLMADHSEFDRQRIG